MIVIADTIGIKHQFLYIMTVYWESDVGFGEFTDEYNPETNEVCHCIDDENVNSELKEEIILSLNKILKEPN